MLLNWTALAPILLLVASNVFMTFAWYGQLKVEHRAMWLIVLISWGIAFFEYCLAVPANRIGRSPTPAVRQPAALDTGPASAPADVSRRRRVTE